MYTPPGVFVTDQTVANYSSSATVPSSVGIFGLASNELSFTETLVVPADEGDPRETDLFEFPNVANVRASVAETGTALTEGTDFELVTREQDGAVYTALSRVLDSEHLTDGGANVKVTYNYSPANFHKALRFNNTVDIAAFYGPAFDSDGIVSSEVTLAAQLALANGAPTVIIVASKDDNEQSYLEALETLNKARDVAIIVPASGSQSLFTSVSTAVNSASNSELERRAIVGVDGSDSVVDADMLTNYASQISNRRVALVAPSYANIRIPSMDKIVKVGGQFIAATVAGRSASLTVEMPLTRKVIQGVHSLEDNYDTVDKNNLSASGVMVVEETAQGTMRVRHGVTTDNSTKNSSEWSIVGATDQVVSGIRNMLDTSGFIGSPITSGTVPAITGMIDSLLTSSVADNVILNYGDLTVNQRQSEPDVIDVRFAIEFLFPLNRIYVTMTSSTTLGTTDTQITGI